MAGPTPRPPERSMARVEEVVLREAYVLIGISLGITAAVGLGLSWALVFLLAMATSSVWLVVHASRDSKS